MKIVTAESDFHLNAARSLFREYHDFLAVDLSFQEFEKELAGLPGKYAPPDGALLLATVADEIAGCVALRKHEPGVCEMKRLYVRPKFRNAGIGKALAHAIVGRAGDCGYARMFLDTLEILQEANGLYRQLGFRKRPPYYDNPLAGVTYWELDLKSAPQSTVRA